MMDRLSIHLSGQWTDDCQKSGQYQEGNSAHANRFAPSTPKVTVWQQCSSCVWQTHREQGSSWQRSGSSKRRATMELPLAAKAALPVSPCNHANAHSPPAATKPRASTRLVPSAAIPRRMLLARMVRLLLMTCNSSECRSRLQTA